MNLVLRDLITTRARSQWMAFQGNSLLDGAVDNTLIWGRGGQQTRHIVHQPRRLAA